MQRYLGIEISNLDSCEPKSVHEFSEGLIIYLSQIGQGGRAHAMRLDSGILCTESFDEGVEVVYGPRWKSTIAGQCYPLEGGREDTT